jgi:hypothetical protein
VRRAPDPVEVVSKHAPTMKIERPAHAGTDKALAAAFPEKKNRGWMVALALLVLLLLGGVALTFMGEKPPAKPVVAEVVPPPVKVEAPVPEVVKTVEPVKVNEPDDVVPLPKNVPTVVAPPIVVKKVFVDKVGCNPTSEWKSARQADISEMGLSQRVTSSSQLNELFDTEGRRVARLIESATSVGDCSSAEEAFAKLKRSLGF